MGSPAEEGSPWGPRSRPVRFNRFPSHKPNCRFGIPTGGDAKVGDRPSMAERHLVVFETQTEPGNWLDRVLVKGSRKPQSGPLSLLEGGTPGRISAVSQNCHQKTTPHSLSSDIRGATSFIPNRLSFRWSVVFDQSIPTGCDAHNHGSRYRSVRLQLRPSQYQARSPLASHVFGSREPTTQTDAPVPSLQQMSVSESAMRRTTAIMLQLHPSRG